MYVFLYLSVFCLFSGDLVFHIFFFLIFHVCFFFFFLLLFLNLYMFVCLILSLGCLVFLLCAHSSASIVLFFFEAEAQRSPGTR